RKVDGNRPTGKMISLSDTELVIERKGKTVSFNRDEVKKVWRIVPPSRSKKLRSAQAGAGIGLFPGLIAVLAIEEEQWGGCKNAAALAAFAGVIVGCALIGYFAARSNRALIYSAP